MEGSTGGSHLRLAKYWACEMPHKGESERFSRMVPQLEGLRSLGLREYLAWILGVS